MHLSPLETAASKTAAGACSDAWLPGEASQGGYSSSVPLEPPLAQSSQLIGQSNGSQTWVCFRITWRAPHSIPPPPRLLLGAELRPQVWGLCSENPCHKRAESSQDDVDTMKWVAQQPGGVHPGLMMIPWCSRLPQQSAGESTQSISCSFLIPLLSHQIGTHTWYRSPRPS